ncbi:MAG: hypothetical protein QM589_09395 [Thermomicrobiales bacterium]
MNPYLATGLVMCAILFIAIVGTAYLAVFFNRRAKADMEAALAPLAAAIDGTVDVDEATVEGRYDGTIVQARVTGAEGGAGRVFQIDLIDAAGGSRWRYRSIAHRDSPDPTSEFDSTRPDLRRALDSQFALDKLRTIANPSRHWFWLEYDPDAGHVRLTSPMQTRRDIPDEPAFMARLAYLRELGNANRAVQQDGPEAAS